MLTDQEQRLQAIEKHILTLYDEIDQLKALSVGKNRASPYQDIFEVLDDLAMDETRVFRPENLLGAQSAVTRRYKNTGKKFRTHKTNNALVVSRIN